MKGRRASFRFPKSVVGREIYGKRSCLDCSSQNPYTYCFILSFLPVLIILHTVYSSMSRSSDSHHGYQYNYQTSLVPASSYPTVWTAPGELYGNEWVLGHDNAGMYQYNENSHGLFYPQTVSFNMTGHQPDGQLWPSSIDGVQSVSNNSWQQMNWNWQPASWQQSSWLQTVGNDSLLTYDDTVEIGGTQAPGSIIHPRHDGKTPQSRIVATTPVQAISDASQSNMTTSRPCRDLWKDVDTRTKQRLKTCYKEMEITEGDEHDMQIWGDIQYMIGKGETSGHVVCKKNELKIHYRICNRSKSWENHYCTALHIHLSTRHDQEVNWDTVAKCYRCQVRNNMSKIRRRKRDAKRKNEIEKSGRGNIE